MFLHYNQVLTSDGLDRIAALTRAKVDRDFPDERLARTTADDEQLRLARTLRIRHARDGDEERVGVGVEGAAVGRLRSHKKTVRRMQRPRKVA